jgi:hypothetical protein
MAASSLPRDAPHREKAFSMRRTSYSLKFRVNSPQSGQALHVFFTAGAPSTLRLSPLSGRHSAAGAVLCSVILIPA